MKRIICAFVLAAACGGDDGGSGTASDANRVDVPGGAGEPANLMGITAAHNAVRAMVDTSGIAAGPLPPMAWDSALAAHAMAYTSMCTDAGGDGILDHSSQAYRTNMVGYAQIGENIFASGSPMASATQAVEVWASEEANFTYPDQCNGTCGHYTQLVWRTSVHLGCANVSCNSLQYKGVILCMYAPAGNGAGAPY
jgi:hypothetical protein